MGNQVDEVGTPGRPIDDRAPLAHCRCGAAAGAANRDGRGLGQRVDSNRCSLSNDNRATATATAAAAGGSESARNGRRDGWLQHGQEAPLPLGELLLLLLLLFTKTELLEFLLAAVHNVEWLAARCRLGRLAPPARLTLRRSRHHRGLRASDGGSSSSRVGGDSSSSSRRSGGGRGLLRRREGSRCRGL